ncbi:hypothetical protein MRS76_18110 [Rhizobiaceae bacterium n13]|uniref:ATP-grasp domain-containing protein n=1 Tax=Ferirhizobium litorale TaxID=2927786 RepID=A0AAE3U5B0_9HYPH|nr:hypothetical protein [Fererhizobium litorale]MDI7863870.1 hypothetical protein [Fererhizobium litorale]MDI7924298.1 hypothetical protein [Fererhizobium litorale]
MSVDVLRPDLLIAGGRDDPCLQLLEVRVTELGLTAITIYHDTKAKVAASLDFRHNSLMLGERPLFPRAAFVRMNVFNREVEKEGALPRAPGWFAFMLGAVLLQPGIGVFNRNMASFAGIKMADLRAAHKAGLATPATLVSNDAAEIRRFANDSARFVAKPVNGGGYCKPLAGIDFEVLAPGGSLPIPAFVQEKLDYPEYRVYRLGDRFMAFVVLSAELDYRVDPTARMEVCPNDHGPLAEVLPRLRVMSDELGLNFCAFDLKTRTATGEVCFLEVNSGPMFAAHDRTSRGELGRVLIAELLALSSPS